MALPPCDTFPFVDVHKVREDVRTSPKYHQSYIVQCPSSCSEHKGCRSALSSPKYHGWSVGCSTLGRCRAVWLLGCVGCNCEQFCYSESTCELRPNGCRCRRVASNPRTHLRSAVWWSASQKMHDLQLVFYECVCIVYLLCVFMCGSIVSVQCFDVLFVGGILCDSVSTV